MYAESGLMFPYFHSFSPDVHQFVDFSYSNKLDNVVQSSTISDYDLGGEGDLFNAPEPIIDQPLTTLDPMTAAMSRISCGEDDLSPQELNLTDMESLQNEEFYRNVFHEYKDIIEKKAETETETSPLSEVFHEYKDKPNFLNITVVDLGNVYVMRRAFSEGDIKTLANGNGSHRNSSPGQQQLMSEHTIEDRWQKLSRYRNKKAKRNFGRKIKYACRKALADNQPRIRGRFAKTEESEILGK